MSKARQRRRAARWARYFNHYDKYGLCVFLGGSAAARIIHAGFRGAPTSRPFVYVRRQGRS